MLYPRLEDFEYERFIFYGPPKSGKSHLAASFPDPAVIDCDGRLNRPVWKNRAFDRKEPTTWKEAVDAVEYFGKRKGWKTLVMDGTDALLIWLNRVICDEKGAKSIGDIAHAIGWERQVARWADLFDRFWAVAESNKSCVASVICCHSTREDGVTSILIRNKLASFMTGKVSTIGVMKKSRDNDGTIKFHVDFGGDEKIESGSRNEVLTAAGVMEPSYAAMVSQYGPTDDQTAKLQGWLKRKGVTEDQARSWLTAELGDEPHPLLMYQEIVATSKDPERTARMLAFANENQ